MASKMASQSFILKLIIFPDDATLMKQAYCIDNLELNALASEYALFSPTIKAKPYQNVSFIHLLDSCKNKVLYVKYLNGSICSFLVMWLISMPVIKV